MRPAQKANVEAERHTRTLTAVELRARGKSYREIADELKVSVSTAFEDVWRHFTELDKMATEKLEQVRKLELARLDLMLARLFEIMERETVVNEDGERDDTDGTAVKAIVAASKLIERRAKLLGLDMPTKIEQKVTAIEPGEDAATVREKLAAALAEVDKQLAEPKEMH